MIIQIDDECADEIVAVSLAQSYAAISQDIKQPNKWHEDDIAAWKELLPALLIVGKWYSFDFEAEIKKAKKKK
jgi:hypothetical protein